MTDPDPLTATKEDGVADPAEPPAVQRLYLHVGLPKSGSTFLQSVMGTNRAALKAQGHVYPFVRQEGMFHAAVEMAGVPARWGLDPDHIRGTFARLLRRGRRLGGTVVISHEIFGGATREQIAGIGVLLRDFDVHLVVTARDLGRTVTAEWQEQVKNGNNRSFAEFCDDLLSTLSDDPTDTERFWRSQNLLGLLDRWQLLVPPERIHLVTCPRSGAPADLLWRRFAEAVELDPDGVDLSQIPVRNESLGTAQIAFLRRVLAEVDGRLEQPWHSRVAKRWFAQSLLSKVPGAKPVAPPPVTERLTAVSRTWLDAIRAGGYRVHGDLDELLPMPGDPDAPHPDDVAEGDMLAGLPGVVAEMLVRTRELNEAVERLRADNAELTRRRDALAARAIELTGQVEELRARGKSHIPARLGRLRRR